MGSCVCPQLSTVDSRTNTQLSQQITSKSTQQQLLNSYHLCHQSNPPSKRGDTNLPNHPFSIYTYSSPFPHSPLPLVQHTLSDLLNNCLYYRGYLINKQIFIPSKYGSGRKFYTPCYDWPPDFVFTHYELWIE